MIRLSPWVYKAGDRYYAKTASRYTGRKRRGNWLLWRRVLRVIPGVWVLDPRDQPFWLDDYGFEPVGFLAWLKHLRSIQKEGKSHD